MSEIMTQEEIDSSRGINMNDAFTYRVISFDHVKKEYTLEHVKTGEIKVITKDDYDYYVSEGKKRVKKENNRLAVKNKF